MPDEFVGLVARHDLQPDHLGVHRQQPGSGKQPHPLIAEPFVQSLLQVAEGRAERVSARARPAGLGVGVVGRDNKGD